MWDTKSKLFDLSADSLKQTQQQHHQVQNQPPQNLLFTDPNSPGVPNDPFGSAMASQQHAQATRPQPQSGFKPGIDTSMMMNQYNMNQQMQMNPMNAMQMNNMQMQQMAAMRQQ